MSQSDPTGYNNLSPKVSIQPHQPAFGESRFSTLALCECGWQAVAMSDEEAKGFADEHRRAQGKLHLSKGLPG